MDNEEILSWFLGFLDFDCRGAIFLDCGRAILTTGRLALNVALRGGRLGRLPSTDMGGESTVMGDGSGFEAFEGAGSSKPASTAVFVGVLAAGMIALGGLITVATPLPLGGMITLNSSSCSLDSFLGGSKGTLCWL